MYVLLWIVGNENYIYKDKQCSDFERNGKVQENVISFSYNSILKY